MPANTLLNKISTYFSQQTNIPFVKIIDKNGGLHSQYYNQEIFSYFSSCKNWQAFLLHMVEQSTILTNTNQNFFSFCCYYGLTYCFMPIYYQEKEVGKIIFGGYKSTSFSTCQLQLKEEDIYFQKKKFLQLPAVKKWEVKKNFLEEIKKINKLLGNSYVEFQELVTTIKDNQPHRFTLKELASIHHFSERKINRLFKENSGKTFKSFQRTLQLNWVEKQLQTNNYTQAELAELLGYSDERSLRRALRNKKD